MFCTYICTECIVSATSEEIELGWTIINNKVLRVCTPQVPPYQCSEVLSALPH